MDEKLIYQIQREGAEALLDAGCFPPFEGYTPPFLEEASTLKTDYEATNNGTTDTDSTDLSFNGNHTERVYFFRL